MARKKLSEIKRETGIVQQPLAQLANLPVGYDEFLQLIKERVRVAQVKAALSVNRELISLYWDIGRIISERQQSEGWGKSIVERLASDLQAEFPGIAGFSPSNVWRMRSFYVAWSGPDLAQPVRETGGGTNLAQPVREIGGESPPQAVAEIPWGHNITLIEKLKDPADRLWYAQKTIENGWSRAVLVHQIESGLYRRQGSAVSNFAATLPVPQSDFVFGQQAVAELVLTHG